MFQELPKQSHIFLRDLVTNNSGFIKIFFFKTRWVKNWNFFKEYFFSLDRNCRFLRIFLRTLCPKIVDWKKNQRPSIKELWNFMNILSLTKNRGFFCDKVFKDLLTTNCYLKVVELRFWILEICSSFSIVNMSASKQLKNSWHSMAHKSFKNITDIVFNVERHLYLNN